MKAIPVFICAILVLGLSAHTTHAQENRKNGEVTLASGEKLSGTFEIKNDRDIYHKILFDGNSSGMNRSYTPKEVNHFSFEDQFFISHPIEVYQVNVGNKFDRSKINTDTIQVFMRRITQGNLTLFYSRMPQNSGIDYESNEHFVVLNSSGKIHQLKQSNIKGMLNVLTYNHPEFQKEYSHLQTFQLYELHHLTKLIEKYNQLENPDNIKTSTYIEKRKNNYRILLNSFYASETFDFPKYEHSRYYYVPEAGNAIHVSAGYQFLFPENNISIAASAGLTNHKAKLFYTDSPERIITTRNIELTQLELNIAPTKAVNLSIMDLYFAPVLSFHHRLSDNSTLIFLDGTSESYKIPNKSALGFAGEAGIFLPADINRIKLGYRYHFVTYRSADPKKTISARAHQIILSIVLFHRKARY